MLAVTATVTSRTLKSIVKQLNMVNYKLVYVSPERPNIYFEAKKRTSIEKDFKSILDDLRNNSIRANRTLIIYCQSLNMCANLYAHFLYELAITL